MHVSVAFYTIKTEPVVLHDDDDDDGQTAGKRKISQEELRHIVVRSLADVRKAENAAESKKLSRTNPSTAFAKAAAETTTAPSRSAGVAAPSKLVPSKHGVDGSRRQGQRVRWSRERRPLDRHDAGLQRESSPQRQPSLHSAPGHHRLSTVNLSSLTTSPVASASSTVDQTAVGRSSPPPLLSHLPPFPPRSLPLHTSVAATAGSTFRDEQSNRSSQSVNRPSSGFQKAEQDQQHQQHRGPSRVAEPKSRNSSRTGSVVMLTGKPSQASGGSTAASSVSMPLGATASTMEQLQLQQREQENTTAVNGVSENEAKPLTDKPHVEGLF